MAHMLKIDHLNTILKYFTNEIYLRLLQLQNQPHPQPTPSPSTPADPQIDSLIELYTNYTPQNEVELEYVRKMTQRVLQIFGFYKWKCRNQSILGHVERQLSSRLGIFVNQGCGNLGRVMGYLVDIARKGFVAKLGNLPLCIHPTPSTSTPTATTTTTAASTTKKPLTPFSKQRKAPHQKSQSRQPKQTTTIQLPKQADFSRSRKRRTASVMCYTTGQSGGQTVDVIERLYSCMNIDVVYMARVVDSQGFMARDLLRRNRSTIKKLQMFDAIAKERQREKEKQREREKERERERMIESSRRKVKTQTSQIEPKQILKQLKPNTKTIEYPSYSQFLEQKKAPIMNLGVLNKKRCKVKTFCLKRNKEKKNLNNQNNFI